MTEEQLQEYGTLEAEKEETASKSETKSESKGAQDAQNSLALKTVGNRPVSGGRLDIAGTYRTMGGDRPILASHLRIVETFHTMGGDRPVFATELPTVGNFYSSGSRPIGVSTIKIDETYSDFGSRPVASNQTDDPTLLMGYID